jgi:hypothetical protein
VDRRWISGFSGASYIVNLQYSIDFTFPVEQFRDAAAAIFTEPAPLVRISCKPIHRGCQVGYQLPPRSRLNQYAAGVVQIILRPTPRRGDDRTGARHRFKHDRPAAFIYAGQNQRI